MGNEEEGKKGKFRVSVSTENSHECKQNESEGLYKYTQMCLFSVV